MLARVLARSVECHCRQRMLHRFANIPLDITRIKTGNFVAPSKSGTTMALTISMIRLWDAKLA